MNKIKFVLSKISFFFKKKDIEISFKRYFVDAMSGMALGLFASLLLGTILKTVGTLSNVSLFTDMGTYASACAGVAMAIGIGYKLKCPPLVLFSLTVVGYAANELGGAGGPFCVFLFAIVAAEFGKMISGQTKLDIILTPLVTIFVGVGLAMLIAQPIGEGVAHIGDLITWATDRQPLLMGILIATILGICLTLPISSAAIAASLGLVGLAGGAGVAGCSAQMIGFAVISYRENKVSGLVSQGIGTSMLQMPNIMKKPILFLPVIIISAINGAFATAVFHLEMNGAAVSSGMGTCGLVGQIGVYSGWVAKDHPITGFDVFGLIMVSLVIPAVLGIIMSIVCRKLNIIKPGDLALDRPEEAK